MAQRKNSGRTAPRADLRENRNASATKAGPGRYHEAGHEKNTPPKSKGAPFDFVLHKASEDRNDRRSMLKSYGRRQMLKAIKFWRAEHKAANDERTDARSTRHYESLEA